jgi:hypothetical protein
MLPEGTTISGHRILGLVGEGGMAAVYEALQVALDRVVALKVVARRFSENPDFRERFRRECYIQAKLDHPHIVPVYAAGESEHGLWLTMRFVNGPTLRKRLREGRLSPHQAIELLSPIAQALDVAHEHGLVHRDIAPQNILIDERERPYLSDFGITKGRGDRSLTRTGEFVGTLDYLAPEQILDKPSGEATDIYALAAVLFECLTGRVLYEKETEAAVLFAHIDEPPPRASEIESSLPMSIDAVLEKGLAKSPGDRYPTASELIHAAGEALRSKPVPAEPAVAPTSLEIDAMPAKDTPPPAEDAGAPPFRSRARGSGFSPRRALALVAAALLIGALALVLGVVAAGDSSPELRRVTAGALEIDLPPGWGVVPGRRSGIPGLRLADPVVLAPADGSGRESATVGVSSATGKTLLPAALKRRSSGSAKGNPVSLGSLEALRYRRLRVPGSADRVAVFAAPTSSGVATVACRPDHPGSELSELCQRLASTLELTRGEAFPLGPSLALSVVLRRQLSALAERRNTLRRRLDAAVRADRQATAASGLAAAFRRTARALSGRRVTPQSAADLSALVEALRTTRDAYKDLATAARREDPAGYEAAATRVRRGEAAVDRRLLAMRRLGYRVGASR